VLIGRAISFNGKIGDCKTLIVEGRVAANAKCDALQVQEAGVYDGEIAVETAEILGRVEGRLRVRGRLTIRAAGQVSGDVTYGELDIATGGRLVGNIRHQPVPNDDAKNETAAEAAPPSQAVATETADKVPSGLPDPLDVGPQPPVPDAAEPSVVRDGAEEAAAPAMRGNPASLAVGTAGERP
jgi:cytoskeletal protein CcmA (bactofilin family)